MSVRVLLTGGSGMLGQAIQRLTHNTDWEIIAPPRSTLDLLNPSAVQSLLAADHFDLILHCAAKVGGIQANMANPARFYRDNMIINTNVINAAHHHGVKNFLFLGSSCMYPKDMNRAITEDDLLSAPLEPTNEAYALAKIAGTKYCSFIDQTPEFHYKSFIPCNLYGPGNSFDPAHSHLIPAIIDKIHRAKVDDLDHVEIWGDGTARRELVYVDDLAQFIVSSFDSFSELPSIMNVGAGIDHSINECYALAADIIGFKGGFRHNLDAPVGMQNKLMNSARATQFGWAAQTSLKEGLEKTYEYYLRHHANA